MKDKGYLVVAFLIALAIGLDIVLDQGKAMIFLARELTRLVAYLSFWR